MKRDLELVRKMVLAIEDSPTVRVDLGALEEEYSREEVGYHAYLLVDAGLAVGSQLTSYGDPLPRWTVAYLTWKGHEFADAARDDTRWNKATGLTKEKLGSVTLEVLTNLLTTLMLKALSLA